VPWNTNSTVVLSGNTVASFEVSEVLVLVMETCYITSSTVSNVIFAAKLFNEVECTTWDVDLSIANGGPGALGDYATPIPAPVVATADGTTVDVCSVEIKDPPDGITTGSPTMKVLVEAGS
jgi:hypothetical protein